jgi:4-diphosphocytidyl-2C-methyl-D-erythritol kinase
VILQAPAKINLCLRVGPLRDDGFHRVTTLFAALELHDTLELEPAAATVVEGFPDDTLVTRALPEFPRGLGVLLVPGAEGLSTADVYAASEPNPIYPAVQGDLIRGVHTVRSARDVAALVANDLEDAACALRPSIREALAAVRDAGALATAVSGSGPTVFGLFADEAAAEAAGAGIAGSIPTRTM